MELVIYRLDSPNGRVVASILRWSPYDIMSLGDLGPFTCIDLFLLGADSMSGEAKRAFKAIELSEQKASDAQNTSAWMMWSIFQNMGWAHKTSGGC